jgi:glycosyltransferase involved in cell wall biosynthesis
MNDRDRQPVEFAQNYQYVFTVFTATYNRAHTLHRVYESLKAQTYRDFEWLIIDDGSTDNTRELVKQWQQENLFPIRYLYQENSGKHIAFNRGVREAKGELFLTFDSDDSCVPQALERFKYHWDSIPEDKKEKFSAVTALCINQEGEQIGNSFPFEVTDSDSIEIRTKYGVVGEKWGFQRTEVLKMFPFPEIPGEKFITEGIVWNRLSRQYKTRYVNEKLRIYYEDTNISLSHSSIECRVKNPQGTITYYKEYSELNIPLIWKARGLINYIRFSFHAGKNTWNIIIDSPHTILTSILLVIGFLFYLSDLQKLNK